MGDFLHSLSIEIHGELHRSFPSIFQRPFVIWEMFVTYLQVGINGFAKIPGLLINFSRIKQVIAIKASGLFLRHGFGVYVVY